MPDPVRRRLLAAELVSVGTELTTGETLDTNAGDTARELVALGIRVLRVTAVPDDLAAVVEVIGGALERADLVVCSGGLGPTPDDLTREAIAEIAGETPAVDPELEAWLVALFGRRGVAFPPANRKQAWRIPSSTTLPNANGTAPGWWVDRTDGRVVVALPGPPRELRPMWTDEVVPRLQARGVGAASAVRTLRLTGIGESQLADRLGEPMLRATNPIVATYARRDAVDVRISATAPDAGGGRTPTELVDATAAEIVTLLGDHVWAEGDATWAETVQAAVAARDWRLATVEVGTGGALAALLGTMPTLAFAELLGGDELPAGHTPADLARRVREAGHADVGLAVHAHPRKGDLAVSVALSSPDGEHAARHLVFQSGELARHRAAIAGANVLLRQLGAGAPTARATGREPAG